MIKELILKLQSFGLSQAEIAEQAGVRQASLSDVINDKQNDLWYRNGKKLEVLLRKVEKEKKRKAS